jgi:TatD DNase family protein
MNLIDTHTHLFAKEFEEDIDEVIQRAKAQGITKFLLPNIDETSIEPMRSLTAKYPNECYSMMGMHPCSITKDYIKQIELVKEWHQKEKFIAVGEIGLDLFWDKSLLFEQQEAFKLQIELAKELKLPIVIHVRDSFDESFEIIDQLNDENLTGIFHCFTGTVEQAQKIINYGGFKLGVGGVVTFKNSGLDKVLKEIDLQHLVLETDSPYLAPTPHRGKRNESSYVYNVADKLSDIHEISIDKIAEITTKNALEIFNLNG